MVAIPLSFLFIPVLLARGGPISLSSAISNVHKLNRDASLNHVLKSIYSSQKVHMDPSTIYTALNSVLSMIRESEDRIDSIRLLDCLPIKKRLAEQLTINSNERSRLDAQRMHLESKILDQMSKIEYLKNRISSLQSDIIENEFTHQNSIKALSEQRLPLERNVEVMKVLLNATVPSIGNSFLQSSVCITDAKMLDFGFSDTLHTSVEKFILDIAPAISHLSVFDEIVEKLHLKIDLNGTIDSSVDKRSTASVDKASTGHSLFRIKSHEVPSKGLYNAADSIDFDPVEDAEEKSDKSSDVSSDVDEPDDSTGNRCNADDEDSRQEYQFRLHDRVGNMLGRSKDELDENAASIAHEEENFQATTQLLKESIGSATDGLSDATALLNDANAQHAEISKDFNSVEKLYEKLSDEFDAKKKYCSEKVESIESIDKCSLVKIRDTILSRYLSIDPASISDCAVGDWVESKPCSVHCGSGGLVEMRREIVIHPSNPHYSVPCPKLTSKISCNTHKCPIDCKVSEWTEWSTCDKKCDTGSSRRHRQILKEAKYRGEVCPPLSEERSCELKPCDVDCVVGTFGNWSECSRTCSLPIPVGMSSANFRDIEEGHGVSIRIKPIIHEAVGNGASCPDIEHRRESRGCGEISCMKDSRLRCISKQKVIVATDVSGSVGFKRTFVISRFVRALTNRFVLLNGLNHIGLLRFSTDAVNLFRGGLSGNRREIRSAITNGIKCDGGVTRTHLIFQKARQMFDVSNDAKGGEGASRILIIITDSDPNRRLQFNKSVSDFKKSTNARVIVISLGPDNFEILKDSVSFPTADNFINIKSIHPLLSGRKRTVYVNHIMSRICPRVLPLPKI